MKKTVDEIDIFNRAVLMRVDFNVPIENGVITDTKRVDSSLKTINYVLSQNCKLTLVSHLGRPEGVDMAFSLKPVYEYLKTIYKDNIFFAKDVVGEDAKRKFKNLKNGQILLLENVRFEKGEEEGDENLAKQLAGFGDVFVNDAFATAHRKHASTYYVAKFLPSVAGMLMGAEVNGIKSVITNPERPFVAIVGGAKVKDKIKMLKNLAKECDTLLIGGAMSQTFLKVKGIEIGKSLFDEEGLSFAKELLDEYKDENKFIFPTDFVCVNKFNQVVRCEKVEKDYKIFDIGQISIERFKSYISNAKTIVMNGPLGMFEDERFCIGTKEIALAICESGAKTLVGGGDSASAIKKFADKSKITHLSTGGGASLKMLEGGELPCLEVLQDEENV